MLEGFLRFPETTQDLSLDDGYAPFQLKGFTRHTQHADCFDLKLRKSNEDFFFGRHEGKLGTFANLCCSVLRSHRTRTAKVRDNRLFNGVQKKFGIFFSISMYCNEKHWNKQQR